MRRSALPKGERRLLEIIERCDFTGNGCCPTQKELTFLAGFKNHRYTNRLVKNLERKGCLRIEKRRSAGCKWFHNVYHVAHWSPQVRRGICNLRREWPRVRAEQEAAEAESGSERTATASKGSDRCGRPLNPRCLAVGSTSAVVEGASNELNRTCEGRHRPGGSMDQSRRSHIQAVPDLTSQPLLEELERKDDIIRKLQLELNKSMENEAGALAAAKAAGNALNAAKGQITREQKKSAKAGQVQQVVDHWRLLRPRTGPEFGEPGSKSFAVIEKALVLMANDPSGAVAACCEAIDGLHMAPWWSYGKRYATPGEGRSLKRDLEHALGDEQRIVKCRGVVRWMRAGGVERAWEKYLAVQETESVLRAEVLDLLGEQRFRREEPAEWCFVDGARTRLDEKATKGTRSE